MTKNGAAGDDPADTMPAADAAESTAPAEVVTAECTLSSGERLTLPVVHITLAGAFIVTMIPPEVGSTLTARFHLPGGTRIGPVSARVIGVRVDPSDPMRTGFEVVFADIDDETLDSIAELAGAPRRAIPSRRCGTERRGYPRIETRLGANVRFGDESVDVEVRNLSMSGAKLEFQQELFKVALTTGSKIRVAMHGTMLSEPIALMATVMWVNHLPFGELIGAQFESMSPDMFRRLENLVLYALIGDVLPLPPRQE